MQLDIFNAFRSAAAENGILFYYTGEFSQNVVAAIGDTLKARLEAVAASQSARRKVFSTFVEMAQNILHYAHPGEEASSGKQGALAVGREGERFFVVCGNPIKLDHVPRLQEKLEPLRRMTVDEIKAAYREQLRNEEHGRDPVSKGAGLGFLTVAREATAPIDYHIAFSPENANGCQGRADFYLRAII